MSSKCDMCLYFPAHHIQRQTTTVQLRLWMAMSPFSGICFTDLSQHGYQSTGNLSIHSPSCFKKEAHTVAYSKLGLTGTLQNFTKTRLWFCTYGNAWGQSRRCSAGNTAALFSLSVASLMHLSASMMSRQPNAWSMPVLHAGRVSRLASAR